MPWILRFFIVLVVTPAALVAISIFSGWPVILGVWGWIPYDAAIYVQLAWLSCVVAAAVATTWASNS